MSSQKQTISQEINSRASKKNIPLSALFELTYRCNLRCYYCFQKNYPRAKELSSAQWKKILGQFAGAGTLYVTLSGGEPFLRDDLFDIIEHARALDFAVSVITNGTLLTKAKVKRLAGLGIMDIGISFHAAESALHDRLSRFPGSFDAALAGLRLCVGAGVKTLVKHTVSNRNFGEFMRLQKLADAEGALFEVDPHVLPSVRGEVSRYALDISHYSLFFKKMKALPDKCFLDKFSKKDDNLHCDAGRSLCGVTPSGDVVPCIQLPIVLGSLKTRSLQEIWNGEIVKKFRRDEKRLSTLCERCKTRRFCSRCHGIAWWESTSWKLPAKSLCFHALAMVELSGK